MYILQASVFIVCPYDGDNTDRKRDVLSDTNRKRNVLPESGLLDKGIH